MTVEPPSAKNMKLRLQSLALLPLNLSSPSVCKKEECTQQSPPECPAHRRLSVKKTNCCDAFECACNCQNSTHTCPAGFITSSSTNDCGCTETSCQPDNVRVASLDCKGFVSFGPPLLKASRFLILSLCRCVWWVAWFTQWRANGNKGAKSALAHSCRTGTHRCTSLSVYRPCAIGRVLRWSRLNTKTRGYNKYFYIFYVILYTLTYKLATNNDFKGKFLYVHNKNLNLEYFITFSQ